MNGRLCCTRTTDAPTMRVSLIVCTRNRASRLPEFLGCIASLDAPAGGWELVLVDNASTDATPIVIDQFARDASFPVQCVQAAVPGLARARNVGLAHARGDILAFTDDDCYPRQNYLTALVDVFDEGRHGFVGGRVVLHDPGDARVCVRDVTTALDIAPRSFVPAGFIHGANMAVTREVLCSVGEFDPLLGAGAPCVAGEDIDYIARAVWAGWGGRYDPRPLVAHHHGRKPGPDAEIQRRGYDYGRGAYYMKRLLDRRSRRVYLSAWYWDGRCHVRDRRIGRLLRELAGGARYVQHATGSALRRIGVRRRSANRSAAVA
jgi:glycosyltransferase involved in cell wall biosynthesis